MYDIAIIGTGPAGLSAALTLKMHNKEIVWFGSKEQSEKISKSEKIANYPGVPMTGGAALNELFARQYQELGLEITEKIVTLISRSGDHYMVLANNEVFEAKAVLLATGVVQAKGFENEEDFVGRGVSYCATCDGMFYKGKTVAVHSSSNRLEEDVRYLEETAGKVYVFRTYKSEKPDSENTTVLTSPIRKVEGGMKLQSVTLADGSVLEVDGLFCLRSAIAPTTLLNGLEMNGAHIVVNRQQETNLPGCFAAGDCTGRPYQIAKSVGEGNVAAHQILSYLSE
ncbi:MAG: NAD(P)/FAD-dependent oxidoreductase [Parasporobacterium sp.]|nr:NAD(P)/FAD-dependent oxidoreductase [Parasporobacterium sp.]